MTTKEGKLLEAGIGEELTNIQNLLVELNKRDLLKSEKKLICTLKTIPFF